MLQQGLDNWHGPHPGGHGLIVASATPLSGIILDAAGWPHCDPRQPAAFDKGKAELAIAAATESAPTVEATNTILSGLTVVFGTAGVAAQEADAARIVADGGVPLCVALLERRPGSVTVLVTTLTSPERERTLH
jgi:hypothetical protein